MLPLLLLAALLLEASGAADPFVKAPPHRLVPGTAAVCDLTGSWVDGSNDEASIQQAPSSLALNVTSLSPSTGWRSAQGQLAADGESLWLDFGSGGNLTARVAAGCSALHFSNGVTWTHSQPLANVTTVHVVFMTHLDIGFTLLGRDVCEEYFFRWYPKGIALSQELRALGGEARYAVTTHPWLLHEFYDAAADCARTARNASMLALMDAAIAAGDIRWHGKPMNNLVELEDAPWFSSSLRLSGALNARFNKTWGALACKSTDVPGFSRSAIPLFAAEGKKSLHMGYNGNCRVPDIPQAFNWVHPDGSSLLALVNNNYGSTILVPGSQHALAFFYSMDNTGPPADAAAVQAWWNATQARFPAAQLQLSSLDAFTEAILPLTEALPQVTGEIGQSWSYGAPADPAKVAAFRAARRLRNEAVDSGWLDAQDPALLAYERRLWVGGECPRGGGRRPPSVSLHTPPHARHTHAHAPRAPPPPLSDARAGPEHNWGLCFGCYLKEARSPNGNWSNALFHALRSRPDYAFIESGNIEKRNFTLPLPLSGAESPGYTRYLRQLAEVGAALLVPAAGPDLAGYAAVDAAGTFGPCGRFASLRFNASTGALSSLVDGLTGHDWAAGASGQGLGALTYRTYTEADFDIWNREYNPGCGPPCNDFAKFGMDTAAPASAAWLPALTALYRGASPASQCSFVAQLALPSEAVVKYGAAAAYYMNFTFEYAGPDAPAPTLSVELLWVNKTATRLAEATFVSFAPALEAAPSPGGYSMDILGSAVSPLEVVDMGTQHLHAVWGGVGYDNRGAGGAYYWIAPLDTPLVAPGDGEHLLHYDGLARPDMAGGWWFNVHNNLWGECACPARARPCLRAPLLSQQAAPPSSPNSLAGTAFPQWYGDNGRARWELQLASPSQPAAAGQQAQQRSV